MEIKSRIENGELSFEDAVKEYSEEDYNNGNLGYFTALLIWYIVLKHRHIIPR